MTSDITIAVAFVDPKKTLVKLSMHNSRTLGEALQKLLL
jgi:hypothetical protein